MSKETQGDVQELAFAVGQSVVYPAHGVGQITKIEKQTVAGMSLEVYVVSFDQDKMILRVPTNRAEASGMRALAVRSVQRSGRQRGPRLRTERWDGHAHHLLLA